MEKKYDYGSMRHVHYHPKRKSFARILKSDLHALESSCSKSEWNKDHYPIDSIYMIKLVWHRTKWNHEPNHRFNKLLIH